MNKGYIKLYRRLADNELWLSEPFTRAQAWIDLLFMANHKPGAIRKRGILLTVNRGQLGHGEETLAFRWRWSRGKVRRFLEELKNSGQIERQTGQKNTSISTLITIINYDKYQNDSTESKTEDGQKMIQKADRRQYMNKNDKNNKNIKKKTPLPDNFQVSKQVKAWAQEKGYSQLEERLAYFKDWAKAADKQYADWDATFRNAVRGDWAKLNNKEGGNNGKDRPDNRLDAPEGKYSGLGETIEI